MASKSMIFASFPTTIRPLNAKGTMCWINLREEKEGDGCWRWDEEGGRDEEEMKKSEKGREEKMQTQRGKEWSETDLYTLWRLSQRVEKWYWSWWIGGNEEKELLVRSEEGSGQIVPLRIEDPTNRSRGSSTCKSIQSFIQSSIHSILKQSLSHGASCHDEQSRQWLVFHSHHEWISFQSFK